MACDAFAFSVFPSVVWGLLKYNGDTTVGKYWKGLTRFIDNGYSPPGYLAQRTYPLATYPTYPHRQSGRTSAHQTPKTSRKCSLSLAIGARRRPHAG